MKSPFTNKEMTLTKEKRTMDFRKEKFDIVFHYYKCNETGEQFTTTMLDEVNLNQIYNQYREKFNIPFPDEITKIRKKYDISAAKMSEILGFGVNSYRQYESGEMPSVANARLIQMADNPYKFIDMIKLCGTVNKNLKTKYIKRALLLAEERQRNIIKLNFREYLLGNHMADIYSGYRNPDFEKFTEMVVFFAKKIEPFKTKMNKLLFYADFLMFKQSCFSISGVRYKALEMGPVPQNFNSIFESMANKNVININYIQFPDGNIGEQFKTNKDRIFNDELFSEGELKVLKKVAAKFKSVSTNEIIRLSHLEEAWKKNEINKEIISYEYAFELYQD